MLPEPTGVDDGCVVEGGRLGDAVDRGVGFDRTIRLELGVTDAPPLQAMRLPTDKRANARAMPCCRPPSTRQKGLPALGNLPILPTS
jgi:hypothetical protein